MFLGELIIVTLEILGELIGKTFSTPTPAKTVRTVKVAPASRPCLRAITNPSKAETLSTAEGVPFPFDFDLADATLVIFEKTLIFAPGFI